MNRPALIASTSLLSLALVGAAPPTVPAEEKAPPNVITVVADDLGFGDTSLYGGEIATPNLERLARDGVTFTEGYVASPVCSPSRWSLLSGREAPRLGADGNYVARHEVPLFTDTAGDVPSLAQLLQDRGYRTMALGKWDLSGIPSGVDEATVEQYPNLPDTVGFEKFWGILAGISAYCPADDPDTFALDGGSYRRERPEQYLTDELTSRAVDWLGRRSQEPDPFFLYLSYNAPHVPFQTRTACDAPAGEEEERHRYTEMVQTMDEGIGRVLDALDEETRRSTIVTFVSDNGPEHPWQSGPLRGRKQTLFEGGVRVPFVTSWPERLPSGTTWAEPVRTLDLLPTYLRAADPAVDTDGWAGTDLVDRLAGGAGPAPYVWRSYNDNLRVGGVPVGSTRMAVRDGRWKWVHDVLPTGTGREHLFDLGPDADGDGLSEGVGEGEDVALLEPEVLERMRQHYRDWAVTVDQRTSLTSIRPATGRPDGFALVGDATWSASADGFTGSAGDGSPGTAVATGTFHTDDRTEVDVALAPGAEAGLVVRGRLEAVQSPAGLAVTLTRDQVELAALEGGRERTLARADVRTAGRHRLQVEIDDGWVDVTVDGTRVLRHRLTRQTPTGGSTALRVRTGTATFRDLGSVSLVG